MQKLRFAVFPLVLLIVSGCAATKLIEIAETPAQQRYSILQTFKEYDDRALEIAEDPTTPFAVEVKLKQIRTIALAAVEAMDEAFVQMQMAEDRLNENPTENAIMEARVRAEIFQERMGTAFDKVDSLVDAVDALL